MQPYYILIVFLSLLVIGLLLIVLFLRKRYSANNKFLQEKLKNLESKYSQTKEDYILLREETCSARDYKAELKARISEQNYWLVNSISSAQQFQKMYFAPDKKIQDIFSNSFLFDRATSIVSGNFYWIEKVENRIYLALGDCTGHAVEGSFMTLLARSLIKKSILRNKEKQEHDAATSLLFIRDKFLKMLSNIENNESTPVRKIALSLCIIDTEAKTIQFAGAKNSIIHAGNNKLTEYKGNKKPIVQYKKAEDEFINHEIAYQENDCLYLFSDGYIHIDEDNRKYTKQRFKKLLQEISPLKLEEQKEKLENTFKDKRLLDDFLVIGIRF